MPANLEMKQNVKKSLKTKKGKPSKKQKMNTSMIKKKLITKNMTFAEIMQSNPEVAMKLAERGMFCGGCPMAMFETIEQGAMAHGVEVNKLLKELNGKK
jgi:hybrid cluster-associated redox disulfide protein